MDKAQIPTYPGRPAEEDLHPVRQDSLEREENRLNSSRETIRQLLSRPQTANAHQASNSTNGHETIDSWSSLFASWAMPAARESAGRHPYALLLGSALLGAYFATSKPLRKIVGSVIVGTVVRNLVNASVDAGARNGGRILQHYLKRRPQKKYPAYQKQEHEPVNMNKDIRGY